MRQARYQAADIEQVYWHTSDPDVFFYVDGKSFVRYHVAAATKETLTTFTFCSANATGGSDPMFMSFDSNRIGLQSMRRSAVHLRRCVQHGRSDKDESPEPGAGLPVVETLAYLSD